MLSTVAHAMHSEASANLYLSVCQSALAQLLLTEGCEALRKGFTHQFVFEFTILACNKAISPTNRSLHLLSARPRLGTATEKGHQS